MPEVNVLVGDDGSNNMQGAAGSDLIYGFDPNGPQGQVNSIAATRVASGLSNALFAAAPPGDPSRLFIVQQTGEIRILDLDSGQLLATPFLTVPVDDNGERGLLGFAFDPDYASNGFFYIYRTVPGSPAHNVIDRYQVSSNPNVADAGSATPIINFANLGPTNHNGGWIGFGRDGYLYATVGDNANSANAQNINTLFGKIVRIDVDSDAFPSDPARNYAIPPDNMFVGIAGADEIFALGLRNPFRASFDRATGDFFIGDVGEGTWEEIDSGVLGANYGWPLYEGPAGSGTVAAGTLTAPIHSYNHSVGNAVIAGYVYRGQSDGLQGQLFFADLNGKIFTLRYNGANWVVTQRTSQIATDSGAINTPTSFGEDALGNLYVTDLDGDVFRLTPVVVSTDQGDALSGLEGDDILFGGTGNDTLNGGIDDDQLNGGSGIDTAVFSGSRASYSIDRGKAQVVVSGPDGTDTVTSTEWLEFDDATLNARLSNSDFDGSGNSDIVWQNISGSAGVWLLDGTVHVGGGPVGSNPGAAWDVRGAGDFNGDGMSDILWQNSDGRPAVWLLNGAAQIGTGVVGTNPGPQWHIIGSGDFNADTKSDILWQHNDGRAAVWLLDGTTLTGANEVGSNPGVAWHLKDAGDFNGDGKSDMLWQHNDGSAAVWLLDGTTLLGAAIVGNTPGLQWHVIGSGDFNGDGKSDILWQHDDGRAAVWLLDGSAQIGASVIGSNPGPQWNVKSAADFDGNATSDILWQHDNGQAAAWLLNGTLLQSAVLIGVNPGADWQIGWV
jgi:glucose/arabinose dehydrogenase